MGLPCVCPSPRSPPPPPTPPHLRFFDAKSGSPSIFTGIYQLYLVLPAVVVARFWHDHPFVGVAGEDNLLPAGAPAGLGRAAWGAGMSSFIVFFAYIVKWVVVFEPQTLGPLRGLVQVLTRVL